jgi:hypothetical protein
MRIAALLIPAFSAAACTSAGQVSNGPADRCESTDCFNQLQVRDYEVVDNTTLVVYVGSQNCPFRVEFSGTFCDLTFMPGGQLVFRQDTFRAMREPDTLLTRVCARDSNIGIDEGPFSTAAGGDDASDGRIPCRIQNIVSLTDDELLELYVDKRVTIPPPPFGTGEIAVPEEGAQGAGGSQEEGGGDAVATPQTGDRPESAVGSSNPVSAPTTSP